MTYAQYGSIAASDFNSLAGGNPATSSGTLNTVWATGGGSTGYGQTALANVTTGSTVAASNWASLINNTSAIASHQGTSIITNTAPSAGNNITYSAATQTNLTTIYNNRLNAASQGSTTSTTVTRNSSWSSSITFTFTITFGSGDQARYFFNAGGQLKVAFSQPGGSTIANMFSTLATRCGTVVLSAMNSGSATIAGTSYTGITKVGGSGTPSILLTNNGYYQLNTTSTAVFKQLPTSGPAYYSSSYIQLSARSNGTQGSNGDKGSIITLVALWDEVPNGLSVLAGAATTVTIVPPSTTYLSNSWGTPTVTGSVVGS